MARRTGTRSQEFKARDPEETSHPEEGELSGGLCYKQPAFGVCWTVAV